MRLVKIAAAVVGGVFVLAVVAGLAVAWLFDPNDYKDTLAAEFERRTGRSLVIERDLALEYVPWLAVETGGIVIGNVPGFSERHFASIESLAARIDLLPLISGEIRIGRIVVDGLELNLEVDAEGRGNWILTGADAAAPAEPGGVPAGGPSPLETLDVDGLDVRDGAVTWRDLARGREFSVSELSVTTGAYRQGAPIDVETALKVTDSQTGVDARIETRATVAYSPGAGLVLDDGRTTFELSTPAAVTAGGNWRFDAIEWLTNEPLTLAGSELSGWVDAPALGGGRRDVSLATPRAVLDPTTGALNVAELTTTSGTLSARWQLAASSIFDPAARFGGRIVIESAPLAEALRALAIEPPDGVDPAALGAFEAGGDFAVDLQRGELELTDVRARALGAGATGTATISGEGPRVTASLAVPAFEPNDALRRLLAAHVPAGVGLEAFDRVALAAGVDADVGAGTLALRDVRAELLGADWTGDAEIALGADVSASGRIATAGLDPRALEAALGGLLTATVDADELGTVRLDAAFRYAGAADRFVLDPLELDVFGLSASGSLTAGALSTAPVYSGRARLTRFDPRDLMQRFGQSPPITSDPRALTRARLDTRFEVTPERGRFSELVLELDDSRITGAFTVEDFADPSYRFDLAIDALDADRYMAPPADEAAAGERAAGDLELTGEALDVLRLNGRLAIGTLKVAGLELADVATRVELGRGRVRLEEAGAALYGGRFDGAFGVDASGTTPTMTLTGRAENLDLAPLITALTGDANFSGRGDFDLSLSGSGVTVTDNVQSAAGTMGFAMRNGAIEGFDLGRTLCSVYNTTQKLPKPPAPEVARTRYTLLTGTASVADGVATSPDLLGRTPFMDVTGRGSLALVEQMLDYELEAKLTGPIEIPNCSSMDALVGESVPLTLGGTLTEPRILPDFGEILKRRVQDALRERATEKLEERVRDRLRDLF